MPSRPRMSRVCCNRRGFLEPRLTVAATNAEAPPHHEAADLHQGHEHVGGAKGPPTAPIAELVRQEITMHCLEVDVYSVGCVWWP